MYLSSCVNCKATHVTIIHVDIVIEHCIIIVLKTKVMLEKKNTNIFKYHRLRMLNVCLPGTVIHIHGRIMARWTAFSKHVTSSRVTLERV